MPGPSRDPRAVVRQLRRSPVARSVAAATRSRRSVATIRRSGRFDEAWYRRQLPAGEPVRDAVAHFVTVGAARGLQPHPLFDPAVYRANDPSADRSSADPFTHFLAGAAARNVDPHPLFDAAHVLARHPEAADHPEGAFGWYLDVDPDREVGPPTPLLPPEVGATPRAFLRLVAAVADRHAAVPDHTDAARSFPDFDHAAAEAYVARMRQVLDGIDGPPLVSVVVPTYQRADVLPATLDSILAQSYDRFEVLVVDDGSTDDTPEVVARYAEADPRVRSLRQDNAGVAAARNRGLAAARGDLVAYLDSDNTWTPEFLATMVATLHATGARAAYAASELRGEDRLEYRGRPFDREVLLERNYIDCITLVHDRALADELGGFDERLRRVVDWDLLNRLSAVTEPVYAPFIATSYDVWEERGARITRTESVGYRFEVRAKQLVDWDAAPTPVPGRTSVLAVCRDGDGPSGRQVAELIAAHRTADPGTEVVVVDDGTSRAEALRLRLLEVGLDGVHVRRIADRVDLTAAFDVAASVASGDVLVLRDPVVAVDAAALHTCAAEVRDGVASAVQPLYLSLDGTVGSSGWLTAADGTPVAIGFGHAPHDPVVVADRTRDAVEVFGCAVDAARFRAVGGLAPVFVNGHGELDLGRRLREAGGRCALSATAVSPLEAWPAVRRHLPSHDDGRELRRRGGTGGDGSLERHLAQVPGVAVDGLLPAPRLSYRGPQRWSPVLTRRPGGPRRWAIKVAAPDLPERDAWGDWHFAVALRDALTELGEHAVVDLRRGWYRPSATLDDVDLVLRGTQRHEAPPGRTRLLWVISHPDEVTADEVAAYDGVFVASERYVDEAQRRWGRPVEPLLQATDPARFAADPDPALATDLLFVGNSRGVRRRIVADALDAGLEPTIYGAGWDGLVPAHLVRGTYVPNEELGRYYASAEVVLADHWDDMRERGFVANRLFDAVAAGASVVCDDVPGVDGLFGGRVRTYRDPAELATVVAQARAARAELGPPDPAGHTFLDRARRLVAWADEHAARR